MKIDNVKLINDALRLIGSATIGALDEDSDLADQAVTVHERLVETAFANWDWRWCRRTRALEQLADPTPGYAYAFAWPAGAMGPPKALFTDPRNPATRLRDFRAEGNEVHAAVTPLYGVFPLRIDPVIWPPFFREFYVCWLAANLAIPVGHDDKLAAFYEQKAIGAPSEQGRGGLVGRALGLDAAGTGGVAGLNVTDSLTSAHWGGGDGWSGGGAW